MKLKKVIMRGTSLPINMIIILTIAVIVLLAIASFFMGSFTPTSSTMSDIDAWNRGCGLWQIRGCSLTEDNCMPIINIIGYDINGDGNPDTLGDACMRLYGVNRPDNKDGSECNTDAANYCYEKCCGRSTTPTTTSTTTSI
jgi:hypothetical protein